MKLLVVTPSLGRSAFLRDTIESVARLGSSVRHVLVSPSSAVEGLRGGFPGLTVIGYDAVGVYPAINYGRDSQAEWDAWTWLNDDDRGAPEGIRRAMALLEQRPEVEIAYGKVDYIDSAGARLGALPVEPRPARFRSLLAAGVSPLSQHGTLVRRSCAERLGPLDEHFRLAADFDYWARALVAGARFHYVDAVVGEYRLRRDQLSGDVRAMRTEIAASARRQFCDVPAWRMRLAVAAFKFRRLPLFVERFRLTGCWRSEALFRRAARVAEETR